MDTATINGVTYHLVPVEGQSAHMPGELFNDELEYAGEQRVPDTVDVFVDLYGRTNTSYRGKQGLICADSGGYLREILRPRQKPALPPPDSTYWVQTIFGIDSFLSWEDKPRSINIRAVDDPHGYVWHPDGNNWLDRVLSKAYDWRTLHIAEKGYFDGDG